MSEPGATHQGRRLVIWLKASRMVELSLRSTITMAISKLDRECPARMRIMVNSDDNPRPLSPPQFKGSGQDSYTSAFA